GQFISSGLWLHPVRIIDTYVLIIGAMGEAYIYEGDQKFCVGPGDALLLSPFVEQGGYRATENVSYYWFHFHKNMLQSAVQSFPDTAYPLLDVIDRATAIYLPQFFSSNRPDKVAILGHQLLHVHESRYTTAAAADYLMTSILIELSEQYSEFMGHLENSDNRNFYKICEWVRVHSQDRISLDDVAAAFSYNKNYLCRMFKQYAGVTVQEYINRIKISKIKQLLYSTNKSVQEIAYTVGYSDEKYMMRLFKQTENITPTQFRNAYSRTHLNSK
ncbi:MAG: AraC family transcriptional regulator, partial [Angelakisella sp.]